MLNELWELFLILLTILGIVVIGSMLISGIVGFILRPFKKIKAKKRAKEVFETLNKIAEDLTKELKNQENVKKTTKKPTKNTKKSKEN